jgi:hypothetical protein
LTAGATLIDTTFSAEVKGDIHNDKRPTYDQAQRGGDRRRAELGRM